MWKWLTTPIDTDVRSLWKVVLIVAIVFLVMFILSTLMTAAYSLYVEDLSEFM